MKIPFIRIDHVTHYWIIKTLLSAQVTVTIDSTVFRDLKADFHLFYICLALRHKVANSKYMTNDVTCKS